MSNLWQLPNELLISSICANFPGREAQIRVLTTLLSPTFPTSKNVVLYGLEATGKSAVTKAILERLSEPTDLDVDEEYEDSSTSSFELRFAIIKSAECITGRHLLERTLGAVARALDQTDYSSRCENLAQLVVELGKLLEKYRRGYSAEHSRLDENGRRFVLVFDGIDKQRDAPNTLLPALARMGEIIPNLTTVFIVTCPRPNFLHTSGVPHIHFPGYSKAQAIKILSLKPGILFPRDSSSSSLEAEEDDEKARHENLDIWTKFCSSVWDSLAKHTGRDLLSFRSLCNRLWKPFIQPLLAGTYTTKQFSKLFLAQRSLFQNEKLLISNLISDTAHPSSISQKANLTPNTQLSHSTTPTTDITTQQQHSNKSTITTFGLGATSTGIESQLPYYSRLLLISAYLCSHNHPRTDILHFSHTSSARRRKKGGGTALTATTSRNKPGVVKHRKISRRLIGAQGFLMERWLAVFWAMCDESNGVGRKGGGGGSRGGNRTADVEMGVATLVSLRLVGRMGVGGSGGGNGDVLDRGVKWRVLVGWESVRSVARSVGVEMEDFLAE